MFLLVRWGEGDIHGRITDPVSPNIEFLKQLTLFTGAGGLLVTMVAYIFWTFVPPAIRWFLKAGILPKCHVNILPRW